jgi:hypothetical protein
VSYYGIAVLLAAGWYAVLWILARRLELPGGVHLVGVALICGGLLAARLSRGFLSRTRGALALLAAAIAVALGWICSLTVYAVLVDLAQVYYGFHDLPSLSTILWAVMMGAAMSAWIMLLAWPVALPALVASFAVTCVVARTLR